MHEYSIARTLLARVDVEARKREASAVRRVLVQVGELSGVEVGLLKTAFDLLRPGTRCGGSELELVEVPVTWTCSACGELIEAGGVLRCASCDAPARLAAGGEILLERIEMEVSGV